MKKLNVYFRLNSEIIQLYKEHLDKVGYDRNKLFERILIDFLNKNK